MQLVLRSTSFARAIGIAFDQTRLHGASSPAIGMRLLKAVAEPGGMPLRSKRGGPSTIPRGCRPLRSLPRVSLPPSALLLDRRLPSRYALVCFSMTERFAKIAITLPPGDLAAADRLARALDRSRSWIVAEAVRRYVVEQDQAAGAPLDATRRVQLSRDMSLSAEARVLEAEDVSVVPAIGARQFESPRVFRTFDEFTAWRRQRSPT